MSREPFYETIYHRKDWVLADAFKPQPGWGRRKFTCPVASLGEHTEDQMLATAHESAPNGYRLTMLAIYPEEGPERVIWSTPADQRLNTKTNDVREPIEVLGNN